jgi:hypothetical protein
MSGESGEVMEESREEQTEVGEDTPKSARGTIIYLVVALVVMALIVYFMVK